MMSEVKLTGDVNQLMAELASANVDKNAYAQNAIDLRKRAVAAEQRNAAFVELLERMLHDDEMTVHWFAQSIDELLTKPAESGASE